MAEAERRATTGDRTEAADARQATQAREATEGEVMSHPTGPAGPGPCGPGGTGPGRVVAMVAQAAVLVAVGLVLIVAALTAPAPAVEPVPWRTATEQERRDHDAGQLAEALDAEWRSGQQEGATALDKP